MLKLDLIAEFAKQFVDSVKDVSFESYYQIHGEPLGYGSTATVIAATSVKTGKEVAVKVIFKDLIVPEMVEQEIQILRKLNHPNIIKLYDVFETPTEILLVMPLCRGNSLVPRLLNSHHFCEKDAIRYIRNLLEAVSYLHKQGVVHRDIKPENILFEDDSPESPMYLADFGFSKQQTQNALMKTMVGTWAFVSPDVIGTLDGVSKYTSKTDIWSVGAITYLMLFGEPPFKRALSNEQMTEEIINLLYNDQMNKNMQPMNKLVSDHAKDFIMKCLEPNPAYRLSADEALNHPWLKLTALTNQLSQTIANLKKFSNQVQTQRAPPQQFSKSIYLKKHCTLYRISMD
ncbi:Calcium/calmodulin-dependent protein kinase type 1 [Tritrichomonas foetus]|uniref:Calcium/calmodulin-dependent protein kinase type 1 n=1 Tax=Tritrichomonas foetus TaxID=1144522 RepID=A0A1J4J8D3_9EUKA|nr:Calcium/calmodulin-dependent protein kinase type 1 [Tritrichomonas foetus]|eukprot:OHS94495.1 Calcium/calmodulin-dependent protein kinase type 1 [Tritrichomonas foetus]